MGWRRTVLRLPVGLVTAAGCMLGTSCTDGEMTPGCTNNQDCAGGMVCVDRECLTLCASDKDCDLSSVCRDRLCVAGQRRGSGDSRDLCGNRRVDEGESCDDGPDNGRYNHCRSDCLGRGPHCGDGSIQTDAGEECDKGQYNSDAEPNACRTDCREPHFGDGVIDDGESCDDGENNGQVGHCGAQCSSDDNCEHELVCRDVLCAVDPEGDGEEHVCGDGATQADNNEVCDDGDLNGTYGHCRTDCLGYGPRCGDGEAQTQHGESCDDGDLNGTYDHCRTDCLGPGPHCGDGSMQTGNGEQCDQGAYNSDDRPDTCRTDCRGPSCGDDVIDNGEVCDDGPLNGEYDHCAGDCLGQGPRCGDAVLQLDRGEQCDEGQNNSDTRANACRTDCRDPYCGDGVVDDGEVCDGTTDDGHECAPDCKAIVGECGDDVIDNGEICDDGPLNGEYNHCADDCLGQGPRCGDAEIQMDHAEQCDDGANNSDTRANACRTDCRDPYCGDGVVDDGEACDIGIGTGYYCTPDCKEILGWCGDGIKQDNEICDDGNTDSNDFCHTKCQGLNFVQGRVLAAAEHSCAILGSGGLKCWGANLHGRLGLEDEDFDNHRGDQQGEMGSKLPIVVLGQEAVVALSGGGRTTCALLEGGTLKCWGGNLNGQLGLGDTFDRGGASGDMGSSLGPIPLGSGRKAMSVSTRGRHTCALLDNGELKCWGENYYGQLGVLGTENRGDESPEDPEVEMGDNLHAIDLGDGRTAIGVATGSTHTCALLDNHKVKCWGSNGYGQMGIGDEGYELGKAFGRDIMGNDLPIVDLGENYSAVSIVAGDLHTCALLDTGDLKCWGENEDAQLGLGNTEDRGDHPNEMGEALPSVKLGENRTIEMIVAGSAHTCALFDNGDLKCWGDNMYGQLGQGDTDNRGDDTYEDDTTDMGDNLRVIDVGPDRCVVSVSAGKQHTCALLDNGDVKCWGRNAYGRLGIGNEEDRGDTTFSDGTTDMGAMLPRVVLE